MPTASCLLRAQDAPAPRGQSPEAWLKLPPEGPFGWASGFSAGTSLGQRDRGPLQGTAETSFPHSLPGSVPSPVTGDTPAPTDTNG